MNDISFVKKKKIQSFNHARIESIDRIKGRVSLSMRNGLISTGTYLYDLNDLREGMTVLVGKLDGSYVIIEKVTGNPRLGGSISMTKYVSPIGENWRLVRSLPDKYYFHLYYLGNDILITGDSFVQNPPIMQARSTDRGENWIVSTVSSYPGKTSLINLGNGILLARYDLANVEHKIIRSTDYGVTWHSVWDIPLTGFGLEYGPDYNGFNFCDLKDGHIVFYTSYIETDWIGYGGTRNIGALSSDYGATWELKAHPPANGENSYGHNVNCYYMKPGHGWGNINTVVNGSSPENIILSSWYGGQGYPLEGWLSWNNTYEYGVFSFIVQVNDNLAYLYKSTGEGYVSTDDGKTWNRNESLPVPPIDCWTSHYYSDKGTILIRVTNGPSWGIRGNQVSHDINGCYGHDRDHSIFWVEDSIWMAKGYFNEYNETVLKSVNNGLNWKMISNNGYPFESVEEIVNLGNKEFVMLAKNKYGESPGIWKSTMDTFPYVPPVPKDLITVWFLDITYYESEMVVHNDWLYGCAVGHRSDSSNEPGVGADWGLYWILGGIFVAWEAGIHFSASVEEPGGLVFCYVGSFLNAFVCISDHISSDSNRPGVGADWESYWGALG